MCQKAPVRLSGCEPVKHKIKPIALSIIIYLKIDKKMTTHWKYFGSVIPHQGGIAKLISGHCFCENVQISM